MLIALLAWLYGKALVGCAVAASAWLRLAWRRWWSDDRPALADDGYLWIATGIVGVLIGVVAGTTARVTTLYATGDVAAGGAPWLLLVSLASLSAGSAALVWGSTVGRSPAAWRAFVVLTGLYACLTIGWHF